MLSAMLEKLPGRSTPVEVMFVLLVFSLSWLLVAFPAAAATTLTVWLADYTDLVEKEIIPAFERQHPGVKVTVTRVPWSQLDAKLAAAFAGGAAPDIFQAGAEYRAVVAEQGLGRPIDDLVASWPDKQAFFPGTWAAVVWRGKTYGVPYLTSPRTILYRTDIFEEAGLDPNNPPLTWEGLLTTALKLNRQNAEGKFSRVGIISRPHSFHFVLPFFLQNGVQMVSDDGRRATFSTPAGVEAIEYVLNLERKVSPPERMAIAQTDDVENLLTGAAAMMYGNAGIFRVAESRSAGLARFIGISPPLKRVQQAGVTYTDWWVISSTTRHVELAWELVKLLSTPENVRRYNEHFNSIPPRQDALNQTYISANPHVVQMIQKVMPFVQPYFSSIYANRMRDMVTQYIIKARNGELTVTEALAEAARQYELLFKQ
ncbi:MAG: extracellular solute-binding protein [Limnochordales bacterium]|nr:extracellular solute-binding protein [Limnochordales bacterium]